MAAASDSPSSARTMPRSFQAWRSSGRCSTTRVRNGAACNHNCLACSGRPAIWSSRARRHQGRGEIHLIDEALGPVLDESLTHVLRLPEVFGRGVEPSAVEQDQADRVLCGRLILLGQLGLGKRGHRRTPHRSGRRLARRTFPLRPRAMRDVWRLDRQSGPLKSARFLRGSQPESPPSAISYMLKPAATARRRASIARSASRSGSARSAAVARRLWTSLVCAYASWAQIQGMAGLSLAIVFNTAMIRRFNRTASSGWLRASSTRTAGRSPKHRESAVR